jgi:serine/threonine protein kinase
VRLQGAGVAEQHLALTLKEGRIHAEAFLEGVSLNGHALHAPVEIIPPASLELPGLTLWLEGVDVEETGVADPSAEVTLPMPRRAPPPGAQDLDATIPMPRTRAQNDPDPERTIPVPHRGPASRRGRDFQPMPTGEGNEAPLQGAYLMVREIARGGMGQIYFGEDPQLERAVAIKVSRLAQEGRDPRFEKEAKVLAQLAHPNVVPVYAIGVDAQQRPYYSMKLVKGRTLQSLLDALKNGDEATAKEYPRASLLTIFRKVCDAMMFAHSKRYLHRDLKPENIMVGEYGEVLVMDWGLAKGLGERDPVGIPGKTGGHTRDFGMTMEGDVMGTPQYMSPEQAEGMVADLDERSDIYSMGGILYAILKLRPPVEGETLEQVLAKVKRGEITSMLPQEAGQGGAKRETPAEMGERVPEALRAITLKAMAKDRTARYPSVKAFAADLDAYQHGFATSALQVSALGQLLLLIQRHRGVSISIATALTAIALLTSGFILSLKTKERRATHAAAVAEAEKIRALHAEKLAESSFAKAQIALAEASFRSGDFPAMSEALERCPAEARDQSWDYLSAKRNSSLRALPFPEFEKPSQIRNVPHQSGQFALSNSNGDIGFGQAETGTILRKIKTARSLRNFAFSGDGLTLAVLLGARELRLYHTMTAELRATLSLPDEPAPSPEALSLNHDGTLLSAIVKPPDAKSGARLQLIELPEGRVRWHFDSASLASARFDRAGTRVIAIAGGAARYYWTLDPGSGKKLTESALYALCQAVHPDGKTVAIGTQDGEVRVVEIASGLSVQSAKLHSGRLWSIAWTADGHLLTMGSEGKHYDNRWLFKLWAPRTLALRAIFSGLQPGASVPWAYDPLSGFLLTQENPLRLWRIPAGREFARIPHRSETGYSGGFLSNSVALARKDWGLTLYEIPGVTPPAPIKGAPVWGERFSTIHARTGLLAISDVHKPLRIRMFSFKGTTLKEESTKPLSSTLKDFCFNPKGDTLAATLDSGSLETVAVPSGESLLRLPGKFDRVVFSGPNRQVIASQPIVMKSDRVQYQLQQIDGTTGASSRSVSVPFQIHALATSSDQTLLAVAGADRNIHFYDPGTLETRPGFRAHDDEIGAITFHPSLPILASASSDGSVKLWDYQNQKLMDSFVGLAGAPVTLAFSPDGNLLLSEAQENTTRIYDVSHLKSALSPHP